MQGGDLSNRVPPIILLRVEDTLVKKQELKGIKRILKRKPRYYVDPVVDEFILKTYLYTDYTIDLMIEDTEDTNHILTMSDMVSRIVHRRLRVVSPEEVHRLLETGLVICYVDNDPGMRARVSHKHCYSLAEARHFI